MKRGCIVVLAIFAAGVGAPAIAQECPDATAKSGVTAFCGFAGPEDIVRADAHNLIISTMESVGHLYNFHMPSGVVSQIDLSFSPPPDEQRWGDPACPAPQALLSHGLDISVREGGEQQLLVVNHGDRESIEYFSVDGGIKEPSLRWRGCVMAAENTQFNDVAGLPDGGFITTDPLTASWQLLHMIRGSLGFATGGVYRWSPDTGYALIPNTEGAYPNGILLSEDGQSFYLNLYQDGEVREHALDDGELLNRVAVQMPDNSSLAPDGTLLVASHRSGTLESLRAVLAPAAERNTIAFAIVGIDPDSFEARVVYESDGSELGGGTVAESVDGALYIGAFRGDRIIRVAAPDSP